MEPHGFLAIRYAELSTILPPLGWQVLKKIYLSKSPDIVLLGEEFKDILIKMDPGIPDLVKEAMIFCRNLMGLGVDDRILIIDNRTGDMG